MATGCLGALAENAAKKQALLTLKKGKTKFSKLLH